MTEVVSRAPRIHHKPKVHKSRGASGLWWDHCTCGHIKWHYTWRSAYLDAYRHSEELR